MNEIDFIKLVKETKTYENFPNFKKTLVVKMYKIRQLVRFYNQSKMYGLDYIKQNQNIMQSDFSIISDILATEKKNNIMSFLHFTAIVKGYIFYYKGNQVFNWELYFTGVNPHKLVNNQTIFTAEKR